MTINSLYTKASWSEIYTTKSKSGFPLRLPSGQKSSL